MFYTVPIRLMSEIIANENIKNTRRYSLNKHHWINSVCAQSMSLINGGNKCS